MPDFFWKVRFGIPLAKHHILLCIATDITAVRMLPELKKLIKKYYLGSRTICDLLNYLVHRVKAGVHRILFWL